MTKAKEIDFLFKNQLDKKRIMHSLNQSLVNSESLTSYYEPLIQTILPKWSNKKCRARIKNILRLSDNVIQLSLKPSRKWKGFQAGQYLELTIEQQGAFVTRCFSISSSVQHWKKTGFIELTIREQDEGRVTPWLFDHLEKNEYVQLSQAKGDFVLSNTTTQKLFIAGGTGITPIKSMLTSLSHHSGEMDLLYFARDAHLYADQLKQLEKLKDKINLNLHFISTDIQGELTQNMLESLFPDLQQREIFLCGPGGMNESAIEKLTNLNVDPSQIFQEQFLATPKRITAGVAAEANITFSKAGLKTQSKSKVDQTLLELAEEERLSPEYGCRMGVCHQCKCTKTKGVVMNTLTGQVSDTSEEEIQLCVSVPLSDLEIEL